MEINRPKIVDLELEDLPDSHDKTAAYIAELERYCKEVAEDLENLALSVQVEIRKTGGNLRLEAALKEAGYST